MVEAPLFRAFPQSPVHFGGFTKRYATDQTYEKDTQANKYRINIPMKNSFSPHYAAFIHAHLFYESPALADSASTASMTCFASSKVRI